jgi:2-dehydro-3-deoxyphosphogluconate aldolase/(4S)-4-hydroxy-2-oxoglutarate aldolase
MAAPATASADFASMLSRRRVVSVIAIDDTAEAVPLARALVAGGVVLLEVTLRTPAAPEAIRQIVAEVPEAVVGVGTIRSPRDVELAQTLGAKFLVSPGTTEAIYAAVRQARLPFLPGVATASEVMTAFDNGHDIVKFFPAAQAGGLPAIAALRGPFANVRFCPTGGIGEANFTDWLAAPGVVAVGGSWLAPREKIRAADWAGITDIARRSVERLTP